MLNKSNFFSYFISIFVVILLSLSMSGLFYSTKKIITNITLVITGNKTTSIIIGHYKNYNSDNSTIMYTSIIEYKDNNGNLHKLISDYSSSTPDNYEEVTIYFNNTKPFKAIQGSFLTIFLFPFLILCFSLLGLLISIYIGQPIFVKLKSLVTNLIKLYNK